MLSGPFVNFRYISNSNMKFYSVQSVRLRHVQIRSNFGSIFCFSRQIANCLVATAGDKSAAAIPKLSSGTNKPWKAWDSLGYSENSDK